MRKLLAVLVALLWAIPAQAQNQTYTSFVLGAPTGPSPAGSTDYIGIARTSTNTTQKIPASQFLQTTSIPAANLLGGSGGAFSGVSVGSGLSLSGGVLTASGSGTPGGAPGTIQYNNSGVFGGFTMSGDCSLNTATGVIGCFSTPATVPQGGTGTASLTAGGVVVSHGTSPYSSIAEVDGSCILGVAGSWTAGSCSGGATGNVTTSVTLTAHAPIIGNGASDLIATAAMTNGQILVGQTAADPLPKTLSGDATLAASGALTLANVISAAGPVGSATIVPILTFDAKGRLTTVTTATIAPAFSSVTGTAVATQGGTGLTSGNSGGLLYFPTTTTIASSSALSANNPLIGGGAGNPPGTGTRSGNTTAFATVTGALISGHCVSVDASGNFVDSGVSGCSGSVSISGGSGVSTSPAPITGTGTISLTTPNATRTTSCTLAANNTGCTGATLGDMASQLIFNNSALTLTIPAITSTLLANGMGLVYANENTATLAVSTTPTINNLPSAATLHQFGWVALTSNGTSLDAIGFPGFGTITTNKITKFIDATGATTAGTCTDNTNIVCTGTLSSGAASGTTGALLLVGSTSGTATLTVANAAGTPTLTLPATTTTIAGLALNQAWTKGQATTPSALTDAATVAVDASLSNVFTVTLGGNRTLGAPTNTLVGQTLIFEITQDGTGSRTLAYNAAYKWPGATAPTLTTTAAARDDLSCIVVTAGGSPILDCQSGLNFH